MTIELHPSLAARLTRSLRGLTNFRGWRRMASALAGGDFCVRNDGVWNQGNMGSLIERQAYLYSGHERDQIDLFLAKIPPDRRGTILDIGANIGTHLLSFGQVFDHVLSFEPNPLVIERLRAHVALNDARNIIVHHVGLGDAKGKFDLFAPSGANQGLGTFLSDEQYDRPLEKVGVARIEVGDAYISEHAAGRRIDAIKCDVQGFELQVFRGITETIARDRPILWIELGSGAHTVAEEIAALLPLLPRAARWYRMTGTLGFRTRALLVETQESEIDAADWVIVPQ